MLIDRCPSFVSFFSRPRSRFSLRGHVPRLSHECCLVRFSVHGLSQIRARCDPIRTSEPGTGPPYARELLSYAAQQASSTWAKRSASDGAVTEVLTGGREDAEE